jgi:hypothetical protein
MRAKLPTKHNQLGETNASFATCRRGGVCRLGIWNHRYAQQPAPPPAPLPEYGSTVTLEQAMKVENAALAEAKKLNVVEAITIVDNEGRLVYFPKNG